MVTHVKNFGVVSDDSEMVTGFVRPSEMHLTVLTRILGVSTAIVVCGVGVDVAYHHHVLGLYVTGASALIFFLEVTWVITIFVHICLRNDESYCARCWSAALMFTRGWRRALFFYLPLSCILAWKPHRLWLSFVAAGLLALLSLLHVASSVLSRRVSCHEGPAAIDSVDESLLNSTTPDGYDRFQQVLMVTEVLDDGISGSTAGRMADSDGDM